MSSFSTQQAADVHSPRSCEMTVAASFWSLFPNGKVQAQLFAPEQFPPVDEQYAGNQQQTSDRRQAGLPRHLAVQQIGCFFCSRFGGEENPSVAEELANGEPSENIPWVHVRHAGCGEKGRRREW